MTEARKIYIAGPMRGLPSLNFPAFHDAADWFRRDGWTVLNPVEIGRAKYGTSPDAVSPCAFLQADIAALIDCHAIALLDGWENSTGARCEAGVALAIGLDFYDATLRLPTEPPKSVLVIGYGS